MINYIRYLRIKNCSKPTFACKCSHYYGSTQVCGPQICVPSRILTFQLESIYLRPRDSLIQHIRDQSLSSFMIPWGCSLSLQPFSDQRSECGVAISSLLLGSDHSASRLLLSILQAYSFSMGRVWHHYGKNEGVRCKM